MAEDRLCYDVFDLREQAEAIKKVAEELTSAKSSLVSNLDALREDWVSTASTRFFEKIDTDWDTAVDTYVSMLNDLASSLCEAANLYDPLVKEYRYISLE